MYLMIICPREVAACEHRERKYPPSEPETLVKRAREGAGEKERLSEAGRIRSTALMDMLTDKLAHY